ncbi:MAG: hypothetical protein QW117_01115 [Candidatus Pacearchaeota archaeon]
MASETILSSPIFQDFILPFILVFSVVFAILDRSNILGEGKKQVNALVGLVIGLLLVSFPESRIIVVKLMPILAVMVVILLVFLIIYGFAKQEKEIKLPRGAISVIVFISIIVVAISLLKITNSWDNFIDFFSKEKGKKVLTNLIFIIAIIVAMISVWKMKGKE